MLPKSAEDLIKVAKLISSRDRTYTCTQHAVLFCYEHRMIYDGCEQCMFNHGDPWCYKKARGIWKLK